MQFYSFYLKMSQGIRWFESRRREIFLNIIQSCIYFCKISISTRASFIQQIELNKVYFHNKVLYLSFNIHNKLSKFRISLPWNAILHFSTIYKNNLLRRFSRHIHGLEFSLSSSENSYQRWIRSLLIEPQCKVLFI